MQNGQDQPNEGEEGQQGNEPVNVVEDGIINDGGNDVEVWWNRPMQVPSWAFVVLALLSLAGYGVGGVVFSFYYLGTLGMSLFEEGI